MNAEQKKRIAHEISNWKNACNCRAVQLAGDRMAAGWRCGLGLS